MSKDSTKTNKLKRDAQPKAVRHAKDAAGRLADYLAGQGVSLSRAQALEALSAAAGAVDWNTFRAELAQPCDNPAVELEKATRRVLHLQPGGEDECLARLYKLMHPNTPPSGRDMWHARSMNMIEVVTRLYFKDQKLSSEPFSTDAFQECFWPVGDRGFLACLKRCEANFPENEEIKLARGFVDSFPAAPGTNWNYGDRLHSKFVEQWGYLAMMVSKQLSDFTKDLLRGDQAWQPAAR